MAEKFFEGPDSLLNQLVEKITWGAIFFSAIDYLKESAVSALEYLGLMDGEEAVTEALRNTVPRV